ncbi:transaldolase-like [Glycine max]|uniref:transaldolase-like n=1 Tax=Glycine max TaxID=3847 RepID=UPI00023C4148|nr:transaldolase-like [Glycine max]
MAMASTATLVSSFNTALVFHYHYHAAFYISRVDATLDKKLEQIGTTEALDLKGKGAVSQAVLAYQLYQKKFSGTRWERLEKRGAKKQRLMWASTNVKNPSYPDTFYVNSLIGPDTVAEITLSSFGASIDFNLTRPSSSCIHRPWYSFKNS